MAVRPETKKTNAIPAAEVEKLVGRPVHNRDGRLLGDLDKVITGPDGQIQKIVVSHGGFLGLFRSYSAVDWQFAKPRITGDQLVLALTPQQVARAPSYDPYQQSGR
ncbi:MAG TPA: PRC-barrel domain-containing protein [Stellaceae bacterium]|nr:PRC-barrel domain-containing protein [Stellaceae bacterium]